MRLKEIAEEEVMMMMVSPPYIKSVSLPQCLRILVVSFSDDRAQSHSPCFAIILNPSGRSRGVSKLHSGHGERQ